MKRTFIIRNIILAIIIIALVIGISYYFIVENGKKYEITTIETSNYMVLKENGRVGIINKEGKKIIEPNYDDIKIPNPEEPVFVCYNGENSKVLNDKNEEIFTNYDNLEPIRLQEIASKYMYEKNLLTYEKEGKFGLINLEEKKVTGPNFEEILGLPYKEGELLVKKDGLYGVINLKGKTLIPTEYESITADGYYTKENGYKTAGYIVSKKTKEGFRYGYRNQKGKVILKPEYNQLTRVTDREDNENVYLLGAKNGQYGIIKNKEEIIPYEYQSIEYDKTNELFVVEKSKKYGIINLEGKIIVPTKYSQIDITGVYLYAKNDQGTTVYNNDGTEASIDTNIAILDTKNEKYKIRIDNENGTKYGIIGKDGSNLVEEKYSYIEYLYDNYFIASNKNGKIGVIDDKDNIKIAIENDTIQKVGDSKILQVIISDGNFTKLYNKDLREICQMPNASIKIVNDKIKIYNENEVQYFDKNGNKLKSTEVYPENKLLANKEEEKWGFVNQAGEEVVEAIYDKVTELNEYGYAAVLKDGKWGAINSQGKVVLEPTYELKDEEPSFIGSYYQVTFGFGEFYFTNAK